MTVQRGEADAEMIGVGLAELGDVVGDRAAGLRRKIRVTGIEEPQQGRPGGGPAGGIPDRGGMRNVHVRSCRATPFARAGCYVASARAETGSMVFYAAAGAQEPRAQVSMIAST